MFGALYAAEGTDPAALAAVAREFSPRSEACGPREITLDLSGLTRLFGDTRTIGEELRRTAADRGLHVRVAIAGTRTAARLMVRHRAGLTVVERGAEPAVLAPLPLALLAAVVRTPDDSPRRHPAQRTDAGRRHGPAALQVSRGERSGHAANDPNDPNDLALTFRQWGLRTLGDVAALPGDEVAARLGPEGVAWQRLARGEDPRPLVPSAPEERFEQALDLEWPIEGLEPLSFVLGRLLEPLSAHLERRDRGAAVLHVRLHLTTREVHERTLQLPAPMRDPRTLRTLALLDLESHPPLAAIDRVLVSVDPTPGRIVQFSLLTRPLPSPERVSTLMARLTALMGEGRCGSPSPVDSWQPGAFAMAPFAPSDSNAIHSKTAGHRGTADVHSRSSMGASDAVLPSAPRCPEGIAVASNSPAVALRRFRFPVAARVRLEAGRPVRLTTDRRGLSGGRVETCAGPWRTSGGWWMEAPSSRSWDRDEWDVTVSDGATYRLFRERDANQWFVEGIVD